jgi:hypothetical protein
MSVSAEISLEAPKSPLITEIKEEDSEEDQPQHTFQQQEDNLINSNHSLSAETAEMGLLQTTLLTTTTTNPSSNNDLWDACKDTCFICHEDKLITFFSSCCDQQVCAECKVRFECNPEVRWKKSKWSVTTQTLKCPICKKTPKWSFLHLRRFDVLTKKRKMDMITTTCPSCVQSLTGCLGEIAAHILRCHLPRILCPFCKSVIQYEGDTKSLHEHLRQTCTGKYFCSQCHENTTCAAMIPYHGGETCIPKFKKWLNKVYWEKTNKKLESSEDSFIQSVIASLEYTV